MAAPMRKGTRLAPEGDATISILDVVEEDETGLDAAELAEARAHANARIVKLDGHSGSETLGRLVGGERGALVLEGFLLRETAMDEHPSAELVGPGDVLLNSPQPSGLLACAVSWRVLADASLTVLDAELTSRLSAWPGIERALLKRASDRAERSSIERAMLAVPSIELRIVLFLWHYATRWGRVTTDGLLVPIEMTHEALGLLVGARRPTVTKAVSRLRARGALDQRANRTWLLRARDADELGRLAFPGGLPGSGAKTSSEPQARSPESLARRLADQRARLLRVRERHEVALALMRSRTDQLTAGAARLQQGMHAVKERARAGG